MKVKIECLREPKLAFGFGTRGLEPRRCLAKAGPVDAGKLHEVRLALVGPAADVEAARAWLSRLNSFMPAVEGNSARYPNWPGAPGALGVRFLLEDRFIRHIDPARLNLAIQKGLARDGFEDLLDLFDGRIQGLLGDGSPHCIVVCLPEEIADSSQGFRVATPVAAKSATLRLAIPQTLVPVLVPAAGIRGEWRASAPLATGRSTARPSSALSVSSFETERRP